MSSSPLSIKLFAELFPPEDAANLIKLIGRGTVSRATGIALMGAIIKVRAADRGIVLQSKKAMGKR